VGIARMGFVLDQLASANWAMKLKEDSPGRCAK